MTPFPATRRALSLSPVPATLLLGLLASACAPLPARDGVAAGAPLSPAEIGQAQSQADVADLKRRVGVLEGRDDTKTLDELRDLRGEVERLRYQTESDTKRDRNQLDSLDRRLGLLEAAMEDLRRNGAGGARAAYVAPAVASETTPTAGTTTVTTVTAPVSVVPPAPSLSLPRPGDAQPVGTGAVPVLPAEPGFSAPAAGADASAEESLYLRGIETAKTGDYAGAQRLFANVAATYPRGAYADDAWYWNGEMAFAQRDYRAAHAAYQTLIERYPDSPKLPDALYKMGQCYQAMGQTAEANLLYRRVVRDYPDSSAGRGAAQKLGG